MILVHRVEVRVLGGELLLYSNAMFITWLMEQEDRDDEVGMLYKVIYTDHNNGCLPTVTNLKDIGIHFINRHPEKFFDMREWIAVAIKAYDEPLDR
jgi:hypothetical protein